MPSDGVQDSAFDREEYVEIEGDGDIVQLTAYCVGCGEVCFEENMLRDTVEDLDIGHPIHDRQECRERAKEVVDE